MKTTLILFTLLLVAVVGCSSMTKSISLGMGIGMAGGAASGALIAQRKGKAAIEMGIIAAILGGLSGHFIHRGIEREGERVRRETLLNLESYGRLNDNNNKPKRGLFYE